MIAGFEFSDLFSVGNLIFSAIIGFLMWLVKDRFFQKQQLRAGEIDNEIKETEQGLKEVELLKETISVYKDVNNDLRTDLADCKSIIKEQKEDSKRYELLEAKVDDLFVKLAVETERAEFLLKENTELKGKYVKLEIDHEALKKQFETYKKAQTK